MPTVHLHRSSTKLPIRVTLWRYNSASDTAQDTASLRVLTKSLAKKLLMRNFVISGEMTNVREMGLLEKLRPIIVGMSRTRFLIVPPSRLPD
jgi:hypothetical protein